MLPKNKELNSSPSACPIIQNTCINLCILNFIHKNEADLLCLASSLVLVTHKERPSLKSWLPSDLENFAFFFSPSLLLPSFLSFSLHHLFLRTLFLQWETIDMGHIAICERSSFCRGPFLLAFFLCRRWVSFLITHIYVCVCTHMHQSQCLWRSQETLPKSALSILWVSGLELGLLGLVTSAFILWVGCHWPK